MGSPLARKAATDELADCCFVNVNQRMQLSAHSVGPDARRGIC